MMFVALLAPDEAASRIEVLLLLKKIKLEFIQIDFLKSSAYDFSICILSTVFTLSSFSGKYNFDTAKLAGAAIMLPIIR